MISIAKRTGILILILLSFFYYNYDLITLFFDNSFSRFAEFGMDLTGRQDIMDTYLALISNNVLYFIIGVPLIDPIFAVYDYNLHNSLFSAHYFFGFFGFLLYGLMFYVICKPGNYFYKGLLVILLIRAFTDQVFFIDFLDIVIYYLVFLQLNKKENKSIISP